QTHDRAEQGGIGGHRTGRRRRQFRGHRSGLCAVGDDALGIGRHLPHRTSPNPRVSGQSTSFISLDAPTPHSVPSAPKIFPSGRTGNAWRPYRFFMRTDTVDHPLAATLLSTMRDARTDNATFRNALGDLTGILMYEALRDAPVLREPIDTPVAVTDGV